MNIDEQLERQMRKEQVLGLAKEHSKNIQNKVRERRNTARTAQGQPPLPELKEHEHPYWKGKK